MPHKWRRTPPASPNKRNMSCLNSQTMRISSTPAMLWVAQVERKIREKRSGKVFLSSDQELKGASDVQNGLDSGGHHSDGSPAELREVRADVQSCEKSTFQLLIQGSEPVPPTPVCLLSSPSLWTPPMPPVTNTGMPARWAAIMVADTVVPPERRCGMTAQCWRPA